MHDGDTPTPPQAHAKVTHSAEARLCVLEGLLAIQTKNLRGAVGEATTLLARAFEADKVDVFVYDEARDTLAAVGTSDTAMGRKQQALGLDRLALSNGGLAAKAFRTGELHLTGHADMDPAERRSVVEELGVRSAINVPLTCASGVRGVFQVDWATAEAFDDADVGLASAAAGWVGLLLDRAELLARATAQAERRGRRAAAEELARLSRREQGVAAAVAEGLTNAQIARRLVIEEGTAANHVRRILLKLGLTSRTQLGVWAVERGLYSSGCGRSSGASTARSGRRTSRTTDAGGRPRPRAVAELIPRSKRTAAQISAPRRAAGLDPVEMVVRAT